MPGLQLVIVPDGGRANFHLKASEVIGDRAVSTLREIWDVPILAGERRTVGGLLYLNFVADNDDQLRVFADNLYLNFQRQQGMFHLN